MIQHAGVWPEKVVGMRAVQVIAVMVFKSEETCGLSYRSDVWRHWLTDPELHFQGSPTMHRLAAVSGLVALVGSEGGMIEVRTWKQMVPLSLLEIWLEGKMEWHPLRPYSSGYIYTRASHLCNSESCWIWTRRDEITTCNMGFVPFSLHMAHVQCYWGKVYSHVGFLFLSSTLPQKGMCADVICLFSTCSLFCCFFCCLIKFTSFFFLWQLKSESIQSSQFQSKLNEVIRTLTQVRM